MYEINIQLHAVFNFCVDSGNIISNGARFKVDSSTNTYSSAIFSIVKLEDIWKEEIELSQSLSAIIKTYYENCIKQ